MRFAKVSGSLLCDWERWQSAGGDARPARLPARPAWPARRPTPAFLPLVRHAIVPAVGAQKPTRAIVWLRCDPAAALSGRGWSERGIVVNQPRGALRTAFLPLAELERVARHRAVERVAASRTLRPCLDKAAAAVGLPAWRRTSGLTGRGVVVGVIDTGVDARHPAFAGRVLSIWDQSVAGPGTREGGYGLEVSGADLAASRDTDGHGTHVAGIALGADRRHGGVAPGADLVAVKTDFNDAHIADALRYVFRRARQLRRPCVVNLSLGGHFDAHDGSDPLSATIDGLVGPGRLVCCAAGNEGNDAIHGRALVAPGATVALELRIERGVVPYLELNGWATAAGRVAVALRSPSGEVTPFHPSVPTGNPVRRRRLGPVTAVLATPGPDPANGDLPFNVTLERSDAGPLPAGTWQVLLRHEQGAASTVDLWLLEEPDSAGGAELVGPLASDGLKIGSPGSARRALTVGATTSRRRWKDAGGRTHDAGLALGTVADFSSEGPLRGGALKPDVLAPGAMIASALSADAAADPADVLGPLHQVLAGTSMSTPFVSGLLALLLERTPRLTPAAARARLLAAASIPGRPAGAFDPKWGFGLVSAPGLRPA